jgi:cell shape-determining protein MreC
VVIEENKRMSAILEEYSNQLVNQEEVEKENEELKKYLEEEMEQNKQIAE